MFLKRLLSHYISVILILNLRIKTRNNNKLTCTYEKYYTCIQYAYKYFNEEYEKLL